MSRGMTKAERLREMEWLYIQKGWTDIEMAERLHVDRTTVFRDRVLLEREHPFLQDSQGRWKIDRMQYLANLKLNLHEALALYLAARRSSRGTHFNHPHIANAIEKLASVLHQPMTDKLIKAAKAVEESPRNQKRIEVYETVAKAWAENRKIKILHRSLASSKARSYIVCPYLIEPSLWGDATYLIGHSDFHQGLATFKIERIEKAQLLSESADMPEEFDDDALLHFAWGIWYSDDEPITVKLRFSTGSAARRVRESIWHPTQTILELEGGGCIWTAQVAELQEILPWVRSWGADCEVLEPKELRETLAGEAKAMAEVYGWYVTSQPPENKPSVLDDFFGGL